MCLVSNTYDHYQPFIPQPTPYPAPASQAVAGAWPWSAIGPLQVMLSPEQLKQLIDAFHTAVQSARTADKLTGQPDCADPEKAKLEARVAELERRLDAMARAAGAQ